MDNTEIIRQINDAWLNIDVAHKDVFNPFDMLSTEDADDFYKKLTWLLMQPDYFSFICKHILNIELLPIQCLVLKEIWGRKFPMLVGSRGFGKALKPTEKIRVKHGWKEIQHIEVGDQVYGSDGNLCNVQYKTELQTDLKFYRIFLDDGRTIDCCEDHLWKVWDGQWQVLKTKNMIENCTNYAIPINEPLDEPDIDLPIHPYVVGFLLGAPCSLRTKTVKILSKDEECVGKVNKLLPYGYEITGPVGDYLISKFNETFRGFSELCDDIGIYGLYSEERFIPDQYKYSGRNNAEFLLRGLMDGGSFYEGEQLVFSTFSERLRDDVIDLMRSLGIKCVPDLFHRENRLPNYRIMVYPNENKNYIQKIEPIKNHNGYCIQVDSPDRTYITKDYIVTHNTFLLSLYCMLRALLLPGRKIVVVGAAFRQSKFLYEYMDTIWKNAPILRDICDKNSGPRSQIDMCRMTLNGSIISALPIGDGCVSPYTLITYDDRVGEIVTPSKALYGNKKFREIDYNIDNGVKATKIVTTKKGYSYEATYNHAMKILRDGKIQWVRTDDMVIGDRILIDRSDRWHDGDELSELEGYGLGLLIADGSLSNSYTIGFATHDLELAMAVKEVVDLCPATGKTLVWNGENDPEHWCCHSVDSVKWLHEHYEIIGLRSHDKEFPKSVLRSNKNAVAAFISGLYDGDGHVFVNTSKGGTSISVNFTNTSKRLVEQLQYILLHFGIISTLKHRDRDEKWNRVYELGIYGQNVKLFAEKIGFRLARKQQKLLNAIANRKTWNSFDDDIPLDANLVAESLDRSNYVPPRFCKSKILSKKSFQQKFLKEILPYCDNPEWGSLVDPDIFYDTIEFIENSECHTYDVHVPDGNEYCANGFFSHNSKIRGMRANDIIADEFACLRANTLVQTSHGLIKISDYLNGEAYDLMNENVKFEYPDTIFRTPKVDVYRIKTQYGYHFDCSEIHKVKTQNGWKVAKDLVIGKDRLLIDNNDYFPSTYHEFDGYKLDADMAWLIGLLISEGTVTNRNFVSLVNTDEQLIKRVKSKFDFEWKLIHKDSYKDKRGWDCKESWSLKYNSTKFRSALYKMGVGYNTAVDKTFPSMILQSPREVCVSFLSGMYEGDGSAFFTKNKNKQEFQVVLYSSSEELLHTTQTVLLKFGILSSINGRNVGTENINYRLVTRSDNAVKLFNLLSVGKWENIIPPSISEQKPQIKETENGRFRVGTTHGNKNVHLGTYDTIEECNHVFKEFKKSARKLLIVQSVEKLPQQEVLYDFHMPETHSFIGNGFVQHNSMNRDIFENVIAGFGAVAAKPSENVQKVASAKKAKELNFDISKLHNKADEYIDKSNQIVLSGTAYYDFNHFAAYWKKWKTIIESGGDSHFIKNNVFNGESPPASFNWEDYSVIRIPVDLVPEGFMDDGQIARSKATVHNGIYLMEFGACGHPQTPIVTQDGIKPIIDVKIGDKVLTHKGRFKPVLKKTFRPYNGQVLKIKSYGYYQPLIFTIDHPFWENKDVFQELKEMDNLHLAPLHELSNKDSLNNIKLDFNFGEAVGHYASGGSISSDFRSHEEVIKNICPGDSHTKLIKHDILFSNKEFLRGFIIGVWSGGRIRKDLATIQLTNKNLINQIKMALSYFGINSSFLKLDKKSSAWKLNISGDDFVKFISIFYNTKIEKSNRKNKIRFKESCIYDFKNRELINYNGFVYNLEVDEDHSYSTPNATIHNCFTTDSQGFFKRSLIESCVGTRDKPILIGDKEVYFDPVLKGNKNKRYIMGVDPASEVDNFSIVILELNEDHRRVVYLWTTTRQDHTAKVQKKLVTDNNFYAYCARKIRELMNLFPIEHIAMDAQGGGIAVYEALHDVNQLKENELPIWEIIDEDKPKESDDQAGLHIIEMCQFAKYEWYAEANHGLRKDLENKVLIFPRFDPVTIGLSIEEDVANNRIYDTLEDCVMEIEELKNELSLIEITASVNGRERWDTPEVKVGVGKKERMRKDRYSSLLMANMAARRLSNQLAQAPYTFYGGFAEVKTKKKDEDSSTGYTGPAWFTEQMKDVY